MRAIAHLTLEIHIYLPLEVYSDFSFLGKSLVTSFFLLQSLVLIRLQHKDISRLRKVMTEAPADITADTGCVPAAKISKYEQYKKTTQDQKLSIWLHNTINRL